MEVRCRVMRAMIHSSTFTSQLKNKQGWMFLIKGGDHLVKVKGNHITSCYFIIVHHLIIDQRLIPQIINCVLDLAQLISDFLFSCFFRTSTVSSNEIWKAKLILDDPMEGSSKRGKQKSKSSSRSHSRALSRASSQALSRSSSRAQSRTNSRASTASTDSSSVSHTWAIRMVSGPGLDSGQRVDTPTSLLRESSLEPELGEDLEPEPGGEDDDISQELQLCGEDDDNGQDLQPSGENDDNSLDEEDDEATEETTVILTPEPHPSKPSSLARMESSFNFSMSSLLSPSLRPDTPCQPASNPVYPPCQPASNPVYPPCQPASNPVYPPCQPASNPVYPARVTPDTELMHSSSKDIRVQDPLAASSSLAADNAGQLKIIRSGSPDLDYIVEELPRSPKKKTQVKIYFTFKNKFIDSFAIHYNERLPISH